MLGVGSNRDGLSGAKNLEKFSAGGGLGAGQSMIAKDFIEFTEKKPSASSKLEELQKTKT